MKLMTRENGYAPLLANFFEDFFTRDPFSNSSSDTGTTIPQVNIHETDNNFTVEMAAPGMKKDNFHVELDNDMLTISTEVTSEENSDGRYSRREFSYQSFRRSFYLPETVEAEKIEARYSDGILRLVIPKREEAKRKPVKTIKIS